MVRLRKQPRLKPQEMPTPTVEAVGLYFLLRGLGVQVWRSGVSLGVAFPRNDAGEPDTDETALSEAITRNWLGLFEIVTAIEAKHKIAFEWLAAEPVSRENRSFAVDLVHEPPELMRRLTNPEMP